MLHFAVSALTRPDDFYPRTYLAALLLVTVYNALLGSWANTQKLAGNKWRFELFLRRLLRRCFPLCSHRPAFTLGSIEREGITFYGLLAESALRKVRLGLGGAE